MQTSQQNLEEASTSMSNYPIFSCYPPRQTLECQREILKLTQTCLTKSSLLGFPNYRRYAMKSMPSSYRFKYSSTYLSSTPTLHPSISNERKQWGKNTFQSWYNVEMNRCHDFYISALTLVKTMWHLLKTKKIMVRCLWIHERTKKWLSYQQMNLRKQPLFHFVISRAGEGRSETVDALDSGHVFCYPFPKSIPRRFSPISLPEKKLAVSLENTFGECCMLCVLLGDLQGTFTYKSLWKVLR